MISKVLKYFLLFSTLFISSHAFWWRTATTTTTSSDCSSEPPTVLKQIPLTYFRTYTYQPYAGNPFTFPFFNAGGGGGYGAPSLQPPILAGARYERYIDGFPTASAQQQAKLALKKTSNTLPKSITTTTRKTSTKPPTTTTTTTTTTPAPTTTPTTTTTTSTTTTTTIDSLINADTLSAPVATGSTAPYTPITPYSNDYPTYNRRSYMNNYSPNYYRPNYPYPDYSLYRSPSAFDGGRVNSGGGGGGIASANAGPSRPNHIQFVPCMCPVSVGMPSAVAIGAGSDQTNTAYLLQSRSTSDEDSDMDLPLDDTDSKAKIIIEPEIENVLTKSQILPANSKETDEVQLTNKISTSAVLNSSEELVATSVVEV